jgi:2-hydroxy-6-oxonona-2,4-dienedioate hydrolase
VIAQPFWADRIAENPVNRERMLALDPEAFIAVMKRWMAAFYFRAGSDLTGASNEELTTILLPTLLFEGNDDIHPKAVSDIVARLIPGVSYLPSPWSDADFMGRFAGSIQGSVFDLYPQLAPEILRFIAAN